MRKHKKTRLINQKREAKMAEKKPLYRIVVTSEKELNAIMGRNKNTSKFRLKGSKYQNIANEIMALKKGEAVRVSFNKGFCLKPRTLILCVRRLCRKDKVEIRTSIADGSTIYMQRRS